MAKVTINGTTVTVQDEFLNLTQEEQEAVIDDIAADLQANPAQPSPNEAAPADEWRRGDLAPVERNERTGELRFAVPGFAIAAKKALERGVTGDYDLEVDSTTGEVAPFSTEMLDDASTLAGLMSPGAPKGAALTGAVTNNALTGAARSNIKRAMRYDGVDPRDVPARLRALGPDAIPGDLGPALQAQTQAVAALPGPGQKTVVDSLAARKAGRNGRIISEVDETLGPAPIPSRLAAENLANKKALRPEYDAVFENASAVDTTPIALTLDSEIVNLRGDAQSALKKVRDMLNVAGTKDQLDPSPRTLFEVRNAIDGLLETEANSKVIAALSDVRAQVDMELAAKVPRIKQVDAKFEELARQKEAFDKGQTLLDSGRTATRPEELADTFAPSAVPERGMGPSAVPFRLTQGNRVEIERLIGTTTNDLNALKTALKGDGSWNRERLVTMYGQEKADKLLGILEREATYSATEGAALGGSRTAVLQEAKDELVGPTRKPGFFQNALNLNGGSALAAIGDKALGWIDKDRRTATGAAMADYLTAREGSNMLQALPNKGPGVVTQLAPSITLRELMTRGGPKAGEAVRIEM